MLSKKCSSACLIGGQVYRVIGHNGGPGRTDCVPAALPRIDVPPRRPPNSPRLKKEPQMNKAELVAAIAADTNLSKADAGRALDSTLEQLASALT